MSNSPTIIFLLLLLAPALSIPSSVAVGARVGGRTEVKDVERNGEIQDLGKFCVQQYNLQLQKKGSQAGTQPLEFSKVVEAQTQVVSGIKYYLKISASGQIYDAEVVVRPWVRAKEMLTFAPSPRSTGN
ncbi:cysteine proteinase inhibitor B [Primulina eburnea]|uniref:cysteine proteinase inhibitor B n=1 Tax=Primulina eburnea TaxID=1245227 RepID=UPI003C6C6152